MKQKNIYYTPLIELFSIEHIDVISMSNGVQWGEVFEASGFGDNDWE